MSPAQFFAFYFSEKESMLDAMEISLKDTKEKQMKEKEDWRKEEEKLFVKIKELENTNDKLQTAQKAEKENVSSTAIQLKVEFQSH